MTKPTTRVHWLRSGIPACRWSVFRESVSRGTADTARVTCKLCRRKIAAGRGKQ